MALAFFLLAAVLPHVQEVAPGVWTAGFADRYGSANCGWVAMSDHTLLIDLPRGIGAPECLAEVRKITGKPARSVILTGEQEGDRATLEALRHNSMGLYPEGPYLDLVGGRYIGHGPLDRFRVEVVDRDHPITCGVEDFFGADEQHTPPYDKSNVRLLLQNRSDEGKVAAAGWAYEPGRGRLVHLAPGHTRDALDHPMFQRLLRNAVNWCLRKEQPMNTDEHR